MCAQKNMRNYLKIQYKDDGVLYEHTPWNIWKLILAGLEKIYRVNWKDVVELFDLIPIISH